MCQGDDGSGLVELDHDIKRFTLMAVLTDDRDEPACRSRDKPNVFSKIWEDSVLRFVWKEVFDVDIATVSLMPQMASPVAKVSSCLLYTSDAADE